MEAYRYAADPGKEIRNAFQFVSQHRDFWVGINLLGEEGRQGGDVTRFAEALTRMRALYAIPVSLHAGELDHPGPEVREALEAGASRVGHGVNLIDDLKTMRRMRDTQTPIEVSLVSNYILRYTPDLQKHPFPRFLRSGIPVCLNTDDPGAWGEDLTDEYFLAEILYHLSWDEIKEVVRNGIRYAFVDGATKQTLLAHVNQELEEFEGRHLVSDWRTKLENKNELSDFAKRYLF